MSRKNYFKNAVKKNEHGIEMGTLRSSKKEISRPEHKPKALRKEIKKEEITREKRKKPVMKK